jgi:AAA domain
MNKPRSASTKIAFTGTNSSGKTTMAMEVCSRLKSQHHQLAELVSSQDRKITWKDEHFPVDPRAHYGMITNLIHAEVQAELKGDAEIVITDRSVLDLYAIAVTDHPDSELIKALAPTVYAWLGTYKAVFYLPPLDYQEDGKRPPDAFRMRTHQTLLNLMENGQAQGLFQNIVRSDTKRAWNMVKDLLVLPSSWGILAEDEKWQEIADTFNVTLFVKQRKFESSDVDVWIDYTHTAGNAKLNHGIADEIAELGDLMFGSDIEIDWMVIPTLGIPELLRRHEVKTYRGI